MSIQSIDRAFDIIELVSHNSQGINLSDMAAALSLPISTVYRITADLVKKGYVDLLEAKKWANDQKVFIDAMNSVETFGYY